MVALEVVNWLSAATKEDLDQLIGMASNRRDLLTQSLLGLGVEVWFDAKTRGIVRGKIIKMNSKSVKVMTPEGKTWVVSPALLHKGTI